MPRTHRRTAFKDSSPLLACSRAEAMCADLNAVQVGLPTGTLLTIVIIGYFEGTLIQGILAAAGDLGRQRHGFL